MKKSAIITFILFVVLSSLVFSAEQIFVRDILDTPQKYYNLQVQLQGDVVDVKMPSTAGERGYYILMDNSDKKIKIVANTLPAPQTKLVVVGIVQIDPVNQVPYVREITRSKFGAVPAGTTTPTVPVQPKSEGVSPIVYILIFLLLLIIGFIAYFLLKMNKKPAEIPQPAAPQTFNQPSTFSQPQSSPSPSAAEGTRQVSTHEVERAVGGLKTKQVPNLLAELKVMTGSLAGKSFPLGYETVLGRITGDIILEDSSVSRKHARIIFANNSYVIENLSSTNPVIVNGDRISASKELKNGDEIILGVIKLKFNLI